MGHIAKLVLLQEDGSAFDARPTVYCAKNCIPVFWFALFDATDKWTFTLPLLGGSVFSAPGFCAQLDIAMERLNKRRSVLQSWLPTELHSLLDQFQHELERQQAPRIGLDATEVALMLEPEKIEEQMQQWSVFEVPTGDKLTHLFDFAAIDFDPKLGRVVKWDEQSVEFVLCGFE